MATQSTPTLFVAPRERIAELEWEPMPGPDGADYRVLHRDARGLAGLLRLRPGAREIGHLHPHGEHHLWVLEGAVDVGGTTLGRDSYLHVPAGLTHRIIDRGTGSLLFFVSTDPAAGPPA